MNTNTLVTWNQLRGIDDPQNRVSRFLGGLTNRLSNGENHDLTVADWSPEIDISEDEKGYLLKADLPEVKKEDVKVTIADETLYVSGERKIDQKRKFHRIERSYGNFRRSFTLPEDADGSKVTADFRDGVLKIHLPTTAVAKSKAIQ